MPTDIVLMHGSMQGRWVPQEKESNGFESMEKKRERERERERRESYKGKRERKKIQRRK